MSLHEELYLVTSRTVRRSKFLRRYEALIATVSGSCGKGRRSALADLHAALIPLVTDEENLMAALRHVESHGGTALGSDRLAPTDMSTSRQWEFVRSLRDLLRRGDYAQGELLSNKVPKRPGSREKRTIYVQTLSDRVVSGALTQVVEPILNLTAEPYSFCGSGGGVRRAIASAAYFAAREQRSRWIVEDLTKAYDCIPRQKLSDILGSALPNPEVCNLCLELAKAPAKRGILQGASISPVLLNIYLDRTLHQPWRKAHPRVPLLRYADDLVVAGNADDDLDACYDTLTNLAVSSGFRLKHCATTAIHDLSRSEAEWLGFFLRIVDGRMSIRPSSYRSGSLELDQAYSQRRREAFLRLHERHYGCLHVEEVVRGHVEHLAPGFQHADREAICREIEKAAMDAGFHVQGGVEWIQLAWGEANKRYLQIAATVENQWARRRQHTFASERTT
ncbi:MAG: hypothetical protein C0485_09560 [Pirellula sp.]|nr:hypothetical protein [Pirellula sp.]